MCFVCWKENNFFLFATLSTRLKALSSYRFLLAAFFSGLFLCVFFCGLALGLISLHTNQHFFGLVCLDNTLKIRKAEKWKEAGREGAAVAERGFVRFLIYACCAISIFSHQKSTASQPFHCAIPSSYNHRAYKWL